MQLLERIDQLHGGLSRVQGHRESAQQRLVQVRSEIKRLEHEEEVLDLVAELLRTLIDREVADGAKSVEKLLTEGLQAVFDDQDLSVRADTEVQRGRVSVDLLTVQKKADGTVTEGVSRSAFGGSVTTVQSILLRIIVALRRGLRPILVLDESMAALDSNYVQNMGRFLGLLCQRMGMDILLVTHNQTLIEVADTCYRIQYSEKGATFKVVQ